MKLRDWSTISRYFLVGMLVSGLAIEQAAARCLFLRSCCRKSCVEICPSDCPASNRAVNSSCFGELVVADSVGARAVSTPVNLACQEYAANTPTELVLEMASEELTIPASIPTVMPDSPITPPSHLAVPESSESPESDVASHAIPDPVLAESTASEADTTTTTTTPGLFDEPVGQGQEDDSSETPLPEPTPSVPSAENTSTQPRRDMDDLFGPAESAEEDGAELIEEKVEEFIEQPHEQSNEQPASDELEPKTKPETDEADDLFGSFDENQTGLDSQTAVLVLAGGLQSNTNRTWTDNTSAHQCAARLVRVTSKNVVLLRSMGTELIVPLTRLGETDLLFVYQQITALRIVRACDAAAAKLAVAWAK